VQRGRDRSLFGDGRRRALGVDGHRQDEKGREKNEARQGETARRHGAAPVMWAGR
jgi:hypothetical protein